MLNLDPLELPAAPTIAPTFYADGKMMSLEHVAAYELRLIAWEKTVRDLIKVEVDRISTKRHMLQFRRDSPSWVGW